MSNRSTPRKNQVVPSVNGFGVLRSVLEGAREKAGCGLGDLTVLSAQVDPYRLDTPAGHRDGEWVAGQLKRVLKRSAARIHWRGLHYAIVVRGNVRKPDGEIYRNTNEDWEWLSTVAGKAARWLGYIPFERISDNRNAEPVIHHKARVTPKALVTVGVDVAIPDAEDLEPSPIAEGFVARQAFHFVFFGEKASLEDAVLPIARAKEADLYLPTGEISDSCSTASPRMPMRTGDRWSCSRWRTAIRPDIRCRFRSVASCKPSVTCYFPSCASRWCRSLSPSSRSASSGSPRHH